MKMLGGIPLNADNIVLIDLLVLREINLSPCPFCRDSTAN